MAPRTGGTGTVHVRLIFSSLFPFFLIFFLLSEFHFVSHFLYLIVFLVFKDLEMLGNTL